MCGQCCKTATVPYSHKELLQLVSEGNESAADFLKIFEPYPSIEEAIKDSPEITKNILDALKEDGKNSENITFYRCKHVLENNLCGIYKNRPEVCERFPSSPWAVVPPNCGYEGWLFQKREEIKAKVRKKKEEIISLETELKCGVDPDIAGRIKKRIDEIQKYIDTYAKYGSKDW